MFHTFCFIVLTLLFLKSQFFYFLGFCVLWSEYIAHIICFSFFFLSFFWCGPFLKSLLNLLQYCFCFMFWFFGRWACGILAPWPGIEPAPSALESEVLTTGPPGKSPISAFLLMEGFVFARQVIHLDNCFLDTWEKCGLPIYLKSNLRAIN